MTNRGEPEENMILPELDDEILEKLLESKQAVKMEIAEIEAYVQNAKPNLSVLEEYRRREEEYKERAKDLDEITAKRDEVKNEVERLRKQRLDEFMQGFNVITQKLKEMYQVSLCFLGSLRHILTYIKDDYDGRQCRAGVGG